MSQDPFLILILLACLAVVVVLMLGLGGFAKGSGWAQKNSNKLMQYRIAAQFVAVLLIVAYVYFRQSGGQ
ncbi:MAG: twin transmembrane helix small protein [Tateyamaria sp.]|uniref:twin transmembrane helix small protein n=1 Tax=Tateyamaria sp. TaxID=1929288 RepID=UPI00328728A4